jgi:hypothetical protein
MYLELETDSNTTNNFDLLDSCSGPEDIEIWVKTCVQNLLDRNIDVAADLFQQGMDR